LTSVETTAIGRESRVAKVAGDARFGFPRAKRSHGETAPHVVQILVCQHNRLGNCAMGLFSTKDWNVIAIIFERREMYRVNGQRCKGGEATKVRDNVKNFERTIFWAVYDQKRAFLEGDSGPGVKMVTNEIVQRLKKELPTNPTVIQILGLLERSELPKAAKPLLWTGYPKSEQQPMEE
jgi:hypothetical protein